MAVEHLEIERKFDVDEAFTLPDLGALPGVGAVREPVEHALEAAYHDTADLRLARVSVSHWCWASATITDPSEKCTS